MSPPRPHNMVNFSPLAAEIRWRVWSTPANFNVFRVLEALLHGTRVVTAKVYGVEHRAPPTFESAAITLGIGPHSTNTSRIPGRPLGDRVFG